MIRIAGRKESPGRPFLYETTREFLVAFGLRDLGDLPKVEGELIVPELAEAAAAQLTEPGPEHGRPPLPPIRLSKILAQAGLASRRAAEGLLADGRVTVNGVVSGSSPAPRPTPSRIASRSTGGRFPARAPLHVPAPAQACAAT